VHTPFFRVYSHFRGILILIRLLILNAIGGVMNGNRVHTFPAAHPSVWKNRDITGRYRADKIAARYRKWRHEAEKEQSLVLSFPHT
jgi:hypothetical protein